MVDLDILHKPMAIGKSAWILRNIVLTGRMTGCVRFETRSCFPELSLTGPVTTESLIEDHGVVLEIGLEVAIRATNDTGRRTPCCRSGIASSNINRDITARKVPNLDCQIRPFLKIC